MNIFLKLKTQSLCKWVSSSVVYNHKTPVWVRGSFFSTAECQRCYGYGGEEIVKDVKEIKISRAEIREAQTALLEYLHSTRSLQFTDAENMSRNSPHFLVKLLKNVDIRDGVGQSVTRFLRYYPINEFEPFFESLGLKPHEYGPLLPPELMFLSDDDLLLNNYQVLCNYGVARNRIGRIFKEATEVFRYDYGVLELKLKAYEELGIMKSFIIKLVACSPYILIGDVNVELIKVLEIMRDGGVEQSWIEEKISEKSSYRWNRMLRVLDLFLETGYNEEQLGGLIRHHPRILFESSGDTTLLLIGFVFKFGSSLNEIFSVLLQFPQMPVGNFVLNLKYCYQFLTEIEMKEHAIGEILRCHTLLLGSCRLKKTNSLLTILNIGKKRLCEFIQENPQELKKWEKGVRVGRIPNSGDEERSLMFRIKFLTDIGLQENSSRMMKLLKVFRGRGTELQERFDCIMDAGLDREHVCKMVKSTPQILNQKKDVIKRKLDFLTNDLGYPISSIIVFPGYLSYTRNRVKLRLAMYNWLRDKGMVAPKIALSSIVACSEVHFFEKYVKHHPKGHRIWQDLKKEICPS